MLGTLAGRVEQAATLLLIVGRDRPPLELVAHASRQLGGRLLGGRDHDELIDGHEPAAAGVVTVDQLVVITFTEKAAAELSTRVRDELERRAIAADDEEQRRRLLDAARDLYRAHIETIHSFATALLRERPVEAGIDPLFEVLEGLAAGLDFDEAYERFQDELLASDDPDLERALRREFGLQELREACEHLHAHRYLLPLAHPGTSGGGVDQALAEVRKIAAELRELMRKHSPADKLVDVVERIVGWVDGLDALDGDELERLLVSGSRAKTNKGVGSDGNWGGEKQRVKDLQDSYNETLDTARLSLRTDALLGLLPRIEQFVREYAEARKRRGKADFDDLLFWARDLLRDSEPARRYFRRRFRTVLIDEFQDTDPVQAELALLLTSDQDPGDDWGELRPGPARLTVVGDPKQSIYRFRRADIAVYDQVKTRSLAGSTEQIVTNFRSNEQLLRALNPAFNAIFTVEPGVQPANVELQPPPKAPSVRRAPVVIAEGTLVDDAEGVRKEEARVIVGLLHAAHEQQWEIRDRRDEDRWRPCKWGDMAILMPARTGIEHYEQALADAGIPYRHEGSRDFFQRDEVRDLIWVLSAADDPTDRIALVGALRSGAFAISRRGARDPRRRGRRTFLPLPERGIPGIGQCGDGRAARPPQAAPQRLAGRARPTRGRAHPAGRARAHPTRWRAGRRQPAGDRRRGAAVRRRRRWRAAPVHPPPARLDGGRGDRDRSHRRRGDRRRRADHDHARRQRTRVSDRRARQPRLASATPHASPSRESRTRSCTSGSAPTHSGATATSPPRATTTSGPTRRPTSTPSVCGSCTSPPPVPASTC